MKFFAYKQNGKIYPSSQDDKDKVDKLPVGSPIQLEYKKVRNPQFLRKYWGLVKVVLDNLPESVENNLMQNHQFRIKTKEDVHFYFKIKNGFIEKKYIGEGGNIAWVPKSIAFDSMSEEEFEEFFNKAVDTACELLTVEKDEMIKEVLNFL